jgi:hypothetical protein
MDMGLFKKFDELTKINEKLNNKAKIIRVKELTQDNLDTLNSLLEDKEYYKLQIKQDINKKLRKRLTTILKDSTDEKKLDSKSKEALVENIISIYNGDKNVNELKKILTNKEIIGERDNKKIKKIEHMIEEDGLRKYMTEEINNKAFIEDIYGKIFDETKHNCYLCSLEIGDNIADMEHKIPAVYSILLINKLRHYSGGTGKDYSFWKSAREKKYKSDLINIYKKINNDKDDDKDAVTELKGNLKKDGYGDDFIDLLVANMYAYAYAHSYCNQAKLSVKFTKIVKTDKCSYCLETNEDIINNFTKQINNWQDLNLVFSISNKQSLVILFADFFSSIIR